MRGMRIEKKNLIRNIQLSMNLPVTKIVSRIQNN